VAAIVPAALGFGDVKLLGLLGLLLGWFGWGVLMAGVFLGLLVGAVGGAVLTLLRIVPRGRNPFGPHMLAGAAFAAIWGPWVAGRLGY
jgi:leader peptidase (prepilin peptidase)/N-methyltransferase